MRQIILSGIALTLWTTATALAQEATETTTEVQPTGNLFPIIAIGIFVFAVGVVNVVRAYRKRNANK